MTIAGLVYWTRAEGIWGGPDDTEEFYIRFHDAWDECPTEVSNFSHLVSVKVFLLTKIERNSISFFKKTSIFLFS